MGKIFGWNPKKFGIFFCFFEILMMGPDRFWFMVSRSRPIWRSKYAPRSRKTQKNSNFCTFLRKKIRARKKISRPPKNIEKVKEFPKNIQKILGFRDFFAIFCRGRKKKFGARKFSGRRRRESTKLCVGDERKRPGNQNARTFFPVSSKRRRKRVIRFSFFRKKWKIK